MTDTKEITLNFIKEPHIIIGCYDKKALPIILKYLSLMSELKTQLEKEINEQKIVDPSIKTIRVGLDGTISRVIDYLLHYTN